MFSPESDQLGLGGSLVIFTMTVRSVRSFLTTSSFWDCYDICASCPTAKQNRKWNLDKRKNERRVDKWVRAAVRWEMEKRRLNGRR